MTKTYDLRCPKHGRMRIDVEKPPIKFTAAPYCPFCLSNLMKPDKSTKKVEKWQPNFVSEGAST